MSDDFVDDMTVMLSSGNTNQPLATESYLLALKGVAIGALVAVRDGLVVGRADDSGFHIEDPGLSRAHLRLSVAHDGTVTLHDLGSRNGTFVNEKKTSTAILRGGERIRLGQRTLLQFTRAEELESSLRQLRGMVDRKLREHEDDFALFADLIHIAPTIFSGFVGEAEKAISLMTSLLRESAPRQDNTELQRAVHTLKGNARSLGLNHIGGRAQAIEELLQQMAGVPRLVESDIDALSELIDDLRRALEQARTIRDQLAGSVAGGHGSPLELDHYEALESLAQSLRQIPPQHLSERAAAATVDAAIKRLYELSRVTLQPLFHYLRATVTTVLATRKGRSVAVQADGGSARVSPAIYRALVAALPHLVRNAAIHGIEDAGERVAAGKPEQGVIRIAVAEADGELCISVADDGRGVELAALRQSAARRGLSVPAEALDVSEVLFAPGVSTARHPDLDCGRGIGTCAAKQDIEAAGGRISVETTTGVGTTFRVVFPGHGSTLTASS